MNRHFGGPGAGIPLVDRAWHGRQAPQGSPVGDQLRYQLIHDIYGICGDVVRLWMPDDGDTTTSTDFGRRGGTWTYDASVAGSLTRLGSGLSWELNGTAHEADTPDADVLSFGDSAVDWPMSVVVLARPDVNNALMTLLVKSNSATAEEWELFLDASGHLNFAVLDESATATLEGRYAAAVGTAWTLLGATYDGTGGIGGIALYTDGVSRTVTNDSSGTFVAMENTAALVHLGARYTTKERFFDGGLALAILAAKALSQDEMHSLSELVNAYYDLAL